MNLTKKLIHYLHRVFDKDPVPFLALRLRYAGIGMTWRVDGARLTTVPVGGTGSALAVDLTQFTLGQLVSYLAAQPGYTVEFVDSTELSLLGAAVLLDGTGDQNQSNGDHLYGYTSVLWSYMEANAVELETAAAQVDQMLLQLSTVTATEVWLDELGSYYAVPRLQGEQDALYSLRIIAEVLRPRGNNVAIAAAITAYTGQITTVTDVTVNSPISPLYNGAKIYDGTEHYNSISSPMYGLFDIEYGYDIINGGDITSFAQIIRDLVGRLRDAGTHLRALSLRGSALVDTLTAPNDNASSPVAVAYPLSDTATAPTDALTGNTDMAQFADALTAPVDGLSLTLSTGYQYNSTRTYDGSIFHSGSVQILETLGFIPDPES